MDHAAYHVVYVDTRMSRGLDGKHLQKLSRAKSGSNGKNHDQGLEDYNPDCLRAIIGEIEEVRTNLERLLTEFNGVHTCICEKTCMANLRRLDSTSPNPNPTIVLSGTTFETGKNEKESGFLHMPSSTPSSREPDGLVLLQHISHEVSKANLSKLIIPVAFIHGVRNDASHLKGLSKVNQARPSSVGLIALSQKSVSLKEKGAISHCSHHHTLRCMDAGAIDVLASPLPEERLQSLINWAYRSHKDALQERALAVGKKRSRKLSWLGKTENKPYAYLREKMVSDLMTGICNPDEHFHLGHAKPLPALESGREAHLKRALGSWSYWGHEFSEDELVHGARFMLEHALSLPDLEKWRITPDKMTSFLMASRAAYNDFVEYHNFRHVVDVMQAVFYFLIQLGTLPEYPPRMPAGAAGMGSPIASLLRPLDALTLLITALGHDVGHPGVNNAFLVSLNAPLAQLYNDRSVLEAFHCAAYSQILRRYWIAAFEDSDMRSLMINLILATDMGVHQKYMTDLGNLQDKLRYKEDLDGFNAQQLEEYRVLTCALLTKCADISNVARPYNVAVQWANILQLEFANQGVMEQDVGISTTLFGGPPELGNLVKLGQSQKSFMNFFAQPLFESVADILPAMSFTVVELRSNQATWTERIRVEIEQHLSGQKLREPSAGALSPRSRSPERSGSQPELSLSEGLPASDPSEEALLSMDLSQTALTPQPRHPSEPLLAAPSYPTSETNAQIDGDHRRTPHNYPPSSSSAGPDVTVDASRCSSGVFSSASNSNTRLEPRRTNNSSPSQLQLAPDCQIPSEASATNSENKMPNDRASEDTLSQMHFINGSSTKHDTYQTSPNSISNSDGATRASKETESARMNAPVSFNSTADVLYEYPRHNRSSSGAHTNNTTISQSTPYSPTGTQATSVLTMDSDGRSIHGRMGSWPERKATSDRPSLGQHSITQGLPDLINVSAGPKENPAKTSPLCNGGLRSHTDSGHRSIGKKGSKFSIFHSWKRRGHRPDTGQ